ncbi:MAG: response regulator [Pseudomonadota bacterium]|jgi:FixJ family two-component response regulator|nr:response regulator [Pseudomonadota bacterium]
MTDQNRSTLSEAVVVSLVDGDPIVRHERLLMLRSRNFNVRAYETCAALLADPASRNTSSIVVDLDMKNCEGLQLLRRMRASGWRGKAILLSGDNADNMIAHEANKQGDLILPRSLDDQSLVRAISGSADHRWSSWTAEG